MCIYHLYVVLIIHMGHTFCYEMYNCMNINVSLLWLDIFVDYILINSEVLQIEH